MFLVDENKTIHVTRGDFGLLDVTARSADGSDYIFEAGDEVQFKVYVRGNPEAVVLTKKVSVDSDTTTVTFELERQDTKIGNLISRPRDYWYEVELNPDTDPDTFIGYDTEGPKIFRLYPEGDDRS